MTKRKCKINGNEGVCQDPVSYVVLTVNRVIWMKKFLHCLRHFELYCWRLVCFNAFFNS